MKTLQEQYNLLNEGKGHKDVFMKSARSLFPDLFNNFTNFSTAVKVLKNKNIISEAAGGVVTDNVNPFINWKEFLSEEAKAVESKPTKEVTDMETAGYDYKDPKNSNNLNFEEMLRGYYAEMKDPKNADKTEDELREMVAKNLSNDSTYYTTNQAFGIMGIGYTEDAPGLGATKEIKGEYKGSGYGEETKKDLPEGEVGTGYVEIKEGKKVNLTDLISEAIGGYIDISPSIPVQEDARTDAEEEGYKDGMRDEKEDLKDKPKKKKIKKETVDSKLAEIEKAGKITTLEAQIEALTELIETKNQRISMVTEDDNLSELVDKKKMKEMQREVKLLEKKKSGMEKMYEKLTGEAYKMDMPSGLVAQVDETEEVTEDFDDVVDDIMDQGKSRKDAEKIAGAINAKYVGNYRNE